LRDAGNIVYLCDDMTTITVNVNNKKSEKAIKALFEALQLPYEVHKNDVSLRSLTKDELVLFDRLKDSLSSIKKWEEGDLELNDARTFLRGGYNR